MSLHLSKHRTPCGVVLHSLETGLLLAWSGIKMHACGRCSCLGQIVVLHDGTNVAHMRKM